jgi:hypothetical protein
MVTIQKYSILAFFGACKLFKATKRSPYRFLRSNRMAFLYAFLLVAVFVSNAGAQIPAPPGAPASPGSSTAPGSTAAPDTAHRPPRFAGIPTGKNDTIITGAIVYQGDTIPYRELPLLYIFSGTPQQYARMMERWNRLRNAVYVTYPYAVSAGRIINDINAHLAYISDEHQRKEYIKSREKELRTQFGNQLEQMSVYQGKILMKLINRQTGNNCYEIIKEYKGGFNARIYQTVAFFFGSSLKQPYDASGDDRPIESVVEEINRMYSRR